MEDMLTTDYDGCGRCLVGVRRLSRKTDKTSSPQRQGDQILQATAGEPKQRPSYGFMFVRLAPMARIDHVALDPVGAEVIREVARRILADETGKITVYTEAVRLSRAGVPSPGDRRAQLYGRPLKGGPWTGHTIKHILCSEAALGYLIHGKRPVLGADGRPIRMAEPLWDRATHDALVKATAPRRDGHRAPKGMRLLTGALFCGNCGAFCRLLPAAARSIWWEQVFGGYRSWVAEAERPYSDLRDMALHATDVSRGPIAGVVVDIPAQGGFASIASLGDGTTSLYTSTGGGTIGAGSYRPVAEATEHLLRIAASHAASFVAADDGGWPPTGSVRFHLVASQGNRYLDVSEACFWGRETHELLMPLIEAAQGVMTCIRRVQDAQSASLPGGATRLMAAAHQGDLRAVEGLLEYGARLEAQDGDGYTALMYAANRGHDDVVRVLLGRGADPNARDHQSSTPLMFAAQRGDAQMVRRLLDSGADVKVRGTHGLTALGFAQQNGHDEVTRILLQASGS
jgi:Ankyrin repeats (many copies)